MNLEYKVNSSTQNDILTHLKKCDEDFIRNLNAKTDIEKYVSKLFNRAVRFESWHKNNMVGLMAVYVNKDDNFVYISNASVAKEYSNKGVATELLKECIAFAKKQGVDRIRLEVQRDNVPAINLYKKFHFMISEINKSSQFMELRI